MFTGIITETGVVESRTRSGISIRATAPFLRKLSRGSSVAVEGACLTVVGKTKHAFSADIMPETAERTTLGTLSRGVLINLELPSTPMTFLSGHIVQGHIDDVAVVKSIAKKGNSRILTLSIPRALSRYIVEKGSIAVNGVSLAVIKALQGRFSVGIIPHTWEKTSLRELKIGKRVNVEVDIIAKYAEKLL